MSDGVLTAERAERLKDLQTQMGLGDEAAQKIIKGAQNKNLLDNFQVPVLALPSSYSASHPPIFKTHVSMDMCP